MKRLFWVLLVSMPVFGETPPNIRTLYNSLDVQSISQHLAFYDLYPNTDEGHLALNQAWRLMAGPEGKFNAEISQLPNSAAAIQSIVHLVNKKPDDDLKALDESELSLIEKAAARLPHRQLKGHHVTSEQEVLALKPEEIDLARGLFLSQMGNTPDALQKIRSYEAMIDLMALQILARIAIDAPAEKKIRAINDFIFFDQGFRFPPHSLYAKDIDVYTFLPSVLDSRKGVCLGVSILYICLAQRLNLNLEMITPPGHIYVRYRNGDRIINIETTARGIDIDSEFYLSVDTRSLQQRNIKEVIGLAHFNQAAVFLQNKDFEKAVSAYEKSLAYVPDDMLTKEFLGYNYLFVGRKEDGEKMMRLVENHVPDYAVNGDTMASDYLNGHVDADGIKAIFMPVDEKRDSIVKKKEELEKIIEKYPKFRNGVFYLATAWLQLHREAEALEVLKRYHELVKDDPTAEYYSAMINMERFNYCQAWDHLRAAEKLTEARNHKPKALSDLRKMLGTICPE